MAEKDEYESKYKELEKLFAPIMSKLYQSNNSMSEEMPEGMPGGMPNTGPNIDEVD